MAGEDMRGGQPCVGNKRSGITTIEEKTLGCIHKGGHSTIMEVVDYAHEPTQKGLVIMDTPGNDAASVAGLAAGGCQMILFETYDGAGNFITSDNPAFENKSFVEVNNSNGMLFPLSPKYLLFIAKGSDGINVVDHRFANTDTIHYFNRIIARYKDETIIALTKNLNECM